MITIMRCPNCPCNDITTANVLSSGHSVFDYVTSFFEALFCTCVDIPHRVGVRLPLCNFLGGLDFLSYRLWCPARLVVKDNRRRGDGGVPLWRGEVPFQVIIFCTASAAFQTTAHAARVAAADIQLFLDPVQSAHFGPFPERVLVYHVIEILLTWKHLWTFSKKKCFINYEWYTSSLVFGTDPALTVRYSEIATFYHAKCQCLQ